MSNLDFDLPNFRSSNQATTEATHEFLDHPRGKWNAPRYAKSGKCWESVGILYCGQPRDAAIHRASSGTPAEPASGYWVLEKLSGCDGFRCQKCGVWVYAEGQKICKCKDAAPSAPEATVESAMAELRKLWPGCSFQIQDSRNADFYKDATRHFEVGVISTQYEVNERFEGRTLAEAMQKAREFQTAQYRAAMHEAAGPE